MKMASQQERAELDRRAREGETVVPGGTGGKSLEAQEHLAEGTCSFSSIVVYEHLDLIVILYMNYGVFIKLVTC